MHGQKNVREKSYRGPCTVSVGLPKNHLGPMIALCYQHDQGGKICHWPPNLYTICATQEPLLPKRSSADPSETVYQIKMNCATWARLRGDCALFRIKKRALRPFRRICTRPASTYVTRYSKRYLIGRLPLVPDSRIQSIFNTWRG